MAQEIVIIGAGGFAREVAWLIACCKTQSPHYDVACFIDRDDSEKCGTMLNNIPVKTMQDARSAFPGAKAVCALGAPQLRERAVGEAAASGFEFATIIHPQTQHSEFVEYAEGSVVCAGNILTTNIVVGKHVHINLDCTVGHDVVFADFATLAPGVHISGNVHIGRGAYFGTGSVVINGSEETTLVIGDNVTVGAGACVVRDVAAGDTVVGIPAKPLPRK